MKQQLFEEKHSDEWTRLEHHLETISGSGSIGSIKDSIDEMNIDEFPPRYRALCHQLALAKGRRYSPYLINRLNDLALRCHHELYKRRQVGNGRILEFFVWQFPNALRRNSKYVAVAALLFLLPLIATATAGFMNEEFIYSLMPQENVRSMEAMYDPDNEKIGRDRGTDTDIFMFGFYIKNNIGISFRTFAGGLLFGLGTIFFLVFNGLHIGAVGGHLTQLGYTDTFYPFVIGHGSFELTAIVFSGAAGLKLGYALLNPGPYRRLTALQLSGRDAIIIVYGATIMLLIAAFLEAFWSSSSTVPNSIKYMIGSALWCLVFLYCCFSGKRHGS